MHLNDEIPKYKKKSNKTVKKSKHMHVYKDCLILDKSSDLYHKGEYCIECGKIFNFSMIETVKISNRLSRVLHQDELLDMYKELEIKEVENIIKDKFVNI